MSAAARASQQHFMWVVENVRTYAYIGVAVMNVRETRTSAAPRPVTSQGAATTEAPAVRPARADAFAAPAFRADALTGGSRAHVALPSLAQPGPLELDSADAKAAIQTAL